MKDDKLHQLFEKHQNDFDVETPSYGHKNRFLEKLNAQRNELIFGENEPKKNLWKPFIGIAASLLLCATVAFSFNNTNTAKELAQVSPEMAKTQSFFTSVITEELDKVNSERTLETEAIIQDALKRMKTLENQYDLLKTDLNESGNDNRVIHAMIENFGNRINVLQTVLEKIETIKTFKQKNNETSITI